MEVGTGSGSIEQDDPGIDAAERDLLGLMMRGRTLAEAVSSAIGDITARLGRYPQVVAEQLILIDLARLRILEKQEQISYWCKQAVKQGRADWYGGPAADATIWTALKQRLKSLGRSEEEIRSVDEDSTAVVSLLENPGKTTFDCRGLAIGHVQSGKTGNMAGVIAKSADTPYKFFVVLSGLTDTLRNQTQIRLDGDLIESGQQDRWYRWTQADMTKDGRLEKGDFRDTAAGGFLLDGARNHLAVMKKNANILRRFRNKLKATPKSILESTPFLIIDDECDQASVNSAQLQSAISATNKLIREIVELLPRVTYVGYTATPFANVLINPNDTEDLYPRDFIYPLNRPRAYFGAAELFGREALEGEDAGVETGYDMIRIVPEEEAQFLRPSSRKAADFRFEVTKSLADAINYFVMTVAAREVRGQDDEHSTMLVHTSMLNSVHRSTRIAVEPYLADLRAKLSSNDANTINKLKKLWDDECSRVGAADFGLTKINFDQIVGRLSSVVGSISVKVENWSSTDRIDYSEPARRYLVVGGNVLARGLTLNGLIVSYFMRTSSQYDTLMQMGRWFGYRKGFADLPRIWMEDDVREAFFNLATVEEEIRRDVLRYEEENITPMQFAVRIRKIPGLAITARSKMRDSKTAEIGYEGQHLQTIRLSRRNSPVMLANWKNAEALFPEGVNVRTSGSSIVREGVEVAEIKQFIDRYYFEPGRLLSSNPIISYIDSVNSRSSALERWNVVVIGSGDGQLSDRTMGALGNVRTVNRAPLKDSGDVAFIKALMSRRDLLVDMDGVTANMGSMSWDKVKLHREDNKMRPLLLLYPIAKGSTADSSQREDMEADADLLGVGLVFTGRPGAGKEYVQADLQAEDAQTEEFTGEDAIPEELIDAAR